MSVVWKAFDSYIKIFFKNNLIVVALFLLFAVINTVYFFICWFSYRKARSKIAELIITLFGINKKDIEQYLQNIIKFEGYTKKFWINQGKNSQEQISSSSEDESGLILDNKIRQQTDQLKKEKLLLDESICLLTRSD
jgi:hypothetical protein